MYGGNRMNVAIFAPIFVTVKIRLDSKFNHTGSNAGKAITCYGGDAFDLATKLSVNNHVIYVTSIDGEADVDIVANCRHHDIDVDYIVYEKGGTGYSIQFTGPDNSEISQTITHYPTLTAAKRNIICAASGSALFDEIDAMVITDIDKDIIAACKAHDIQVFWLIEDKDLEYADDFEFDLVDAHEVTVISLTNYQEVLK